MTNFLLIILCLGAGVALSRWRVVPEGAYRSVNAWLLYIAIPALALRYIPEIEWGVQMILPGVAPVIIWSGAWAFVSIYARRTRLDLSTRTAMTVCCGLGNTSFLGFPLISAYYGEDQLHHAIIFDQVTFLLFSTVALIMVVRASQEQSRKTGFGYIVRKVFTFPSFLACVAALLLSRVVDFSPAYPLLDKLVATMSPLALFSIGLQLRISEWRSERKHILWGLGYKLMLAPALILLFALLMGGEGNLARITVFESSMASHITASIMASQYNMNPRFCSLMVGVGILVSFATTAGWWAATVGVF